MLVVSIPVILFATIVLVVHGLFVFLIGRKLLRLPIPDLLVASNANIGGASTAAVFASERNWGDLTLAGILLGSIGYLVATPLGLLAFSLLSSQVR